MTRWIRPILLSQVALLSAALLGACSSAVATRVAAPLASGAQTQLVDGGEATVKVTWPGRQAGPVFEVILDTHAVDLDGYDLTILATLRADDGPVVVPSSWDAAMGGHHRSGRLVFPATGADGRPTIADGARVLELTVRDVAGVQARIFRWTP